MTAFKQVLTNLQAGQREEAQIGLEFVLRLDPKFAPAVNLKRQLTSTADEIDLGDIIAQLQAPTTEAINGLLIEAVDDFNSREFLGAKEKVEEVLIDLPGHQEARDLRDQIDKALKIEGQVGQFLIQAREALGKDDAQEAANFVMMAQALDPHHTGIASTLKDINETSGLDLTQEPIAEPPAEAPAPTEEPPAIPTSPPVAEEAPGPAEDQEAPAADEAAFAVEFDAQDPFSGLLENESAVSPPDPDFGSADGSSVSFPPMDDTADLFTAPNGVPGVEGPESPAAPPGVEGQEPDDAADQAASDEAIGKAIQEFIEGGQAAFDAGDQPLAISLWSKIFLIKPTHPEAGHLIENAKKVLAEAENQAGALLNKARDAFDEGEHDAARLLITKALALRPNHLDVHVLKEELDREQNISGSEPTIGHTAERAPAPASDSQPAAPELPELDDDLFGDMLEEAAGTQPAGDDAGEALQDDLFQEGHEELGDFDGFEELSLVDRLRRKLPMRFVVIGAVALVVVLAGIWLGSSFLTAEPEVDESAAVNEVLVEADRLFKQNKAEEALHLLREFPSAGLSQQRIDMRIAKYEEALAPPTPTPIPEHASRAESLLDQGLWWSAYVAAGDGIKVHPDDSGLKEIRRLVLETEPEASVLENSLRIRDFRTAVSITEDLLAQYPGQGDLMVVLERSLFNAALAESRAYNLTGAENHLLRLLEFKPEDEEAIRFMEFVQKYKVRAADMRLEIFIRSMNER